MISQADPCVERTKPPWVAPKRAGYLILAKLPYAMKQDKIRLMSRHNSKIAQPYKNRVISFLQRVLASVHDAGLRRIYGWVAVDSATLFGILTRFWRLGTGPVTALLVAWRFTAELQGYYYTFSSLLALQVFAELGLGTVVVQFASHEWSRLKIDASGRIAGDPDAHSRLTSLAQAALRWYLAAAGLAAVGLGGGGWAFFSRQPTAGINWLAPWLVLCALSGFKLLLVPLWSLLEGCNQVAQVYAYRMLETVLSSLTLWLALLMGARLWSGPLATAVALVWAFLLLTQRYRAFVSSLFSPRAGPRIRWGADIWPMQWRIALSWLSGYLVFSLFTPVLFHFHGPVVAGQVGMTWSLVNAISAIAYTFIATKVPRFGALIARRTYGKLDRLFLRSVLSSLVVAGLGALAVALGIYGLGVLGHPLSERFLPLAPTALFLVAMVLDQISFAMAAYLRSHKREPFMVIMITRAVLTTVSTVALGSRFAAPGVAAGLLAVNSLTLVPAAITFFRRRATWHQYPTGALAG